MKRYKVTFQCFGHKDKTQIFEYPKTYSDHDIFCWSEVWAIQHYKERYEAVKIEVIE